MIARKGMTGLVLCAVLCAAAPAAWATRFEYDALSRLTRVTYNNGDIISYVYDPAGNITRVTAHGRCSASVLSQIVDDVEKDDDDAVPRFTFRGVQGEAVTLRLEAVPPQAGVGRFATVKLIGPADDDFLRLHPEEVEEFKRTVRSALPTQLTAVLPFAGEFEVVVKQHEVSGQMPYLGEIRILLEGSPTACNSFAAAPPPPDTPTERRARGGPIRR